MDDQDTIRRRIINRAADLFSEKNPNGGGLFTTAHYGQAMKAEFKTPGPTLDGQTCTKHLLEMGDIVEKAGSNLWRRRSQQVNPFDSDITEIVDDADRDEFMTQSIAWAEEAVLQLLTSPPPVMSVIVGTVWWTIDNVTDALVANTGNVRDESHIRNLAGCVLYGMAVEGLILVRRNVVLEGERRTMFTLASEADADLCPPFEGSPDDESFDDRSL